jgi:hypothetical protein
MNWIDDQVRVAEERWSQHFAESVHNMRFNPKKAWEDINKLAAGKGAIKSKKTVCFRMKNGKLATTDKENMDVAAAYFHKVYNNQNDIDPNVLDKLSNRDIVENVDAIPTFTEFN